MVQVHVFPSKPHLYQVESHHLFCCNQMSPGLLSSAAELQFVMDGVSSGSLPLLELEEGTVCSAEMMVTTYQVLLAHYIVILQNTKQNQYFYTNSLENATEFVRAIAEDIQRPFSVR